MNKIKINLDRVSISSEEIANRMNFEDILVHQKIMAKPFYKTTWFFGVTGLATVSLIAGSMYALQPEGDNLIKNKILTENVPIQDLVETQKNTDPIVMVQSSKSKKETDKKELPIDKKSTLKLTTTNQKPSKLSEEVIEQKENTTEVETASAKTDVVESKTFSYIDLYPRISGKLNGNITKQQLLNDEGLVTNSDVKIVSFQLHLVDGTGGRVFEGKGNKLNSEMKTAIDQINVGEEIYFEKIDGQATTGEIVRLSPLRYVLLN